MPTFGTPTYAARTSGASFLNIDRPADLKDGDILIAALRSQQADGTVPWSAPHGFTLVSADPVLPSTVARVGGVWVKQISEVAMEPESYTFTGPGARAVGIMAACTYEREGEVTRVSQLPYGAVGMTSDGVATVPDTPLTAAPSLGILAVGTDAVDGISGTPASTGNFTEIGHLQSSQDNSTTGSRTALWLGWRDEPDTTMNGFTAGYPGTAATGVYYAAFTGGTLPTGEAPATPPGFRSVAQMLSTPGATWAHRGGSTTWPEMSEIAYHNASMAGYGALEFSAARTSDGVWFGLHDQDINRTSMTTGLPAASEMTWDQVQSYPNKINAPTEGVPYMRLTDFMDTYAGTHVVIIDPKYTFRHLDEFFSILSSYTKDRARIIIKNYGPHSGASDVHARCQAAGFSSWGYFYPAQVLNGELAAFEQYWSILGMEYSASQQDWDQILSYKKPVVGHICGSTTSYNMAIAKGAHMVQCSGVAVIPAVGAPNAPQSWDALYHGGSKVPVRSAYLGSTKLTP